SIFSVEIVSVFLTILALNDNQLQALSEGLFDRLGKLQHLDLSKNQLKSIPRDWW
uniref:Variable lymphocyte receptor B cassette n=1 Tax=Petromyzon marinus TaxID=7757 RepID=S4RM13_PETMA